MIQISSHLLFISAVGHRVSTVGSKWEEWRASACSDGTSGKQRIAKHLFNFELCRFIRRFIRSNVDSCQTIQSMISKQQDQSVLWGWSLLWKWHRASEGHQQRNHYANSPPLCLTSNNTALYIYAKPGKTLCTQPCCQSRVMLERWHPMGDPCLRARLLGQTSRWTLTDAHKTNRVTTCGTRDISEVKRGWTLRSFLIAQKPDRTRMIWFLEPFSSRWGEKYLISTLKFTQQPVYSAATKKLEIKHGKPH